MLAEKAVSEPNTPNEKISQENFVADGRIYILGPFDRSISINIIPCLVAMVEDLKTQKDPMIEIFINSFGGYACELFGLLSVLQMARDFGIKIITHNIGAAYSCGSILAVFGDFRTMSRYADNVAHLGSAEMEFKTFKQLDRENDYYKKHFNKILDIYAEHTNVPRKKLEEMLSDDKLHLDPKQCLKLGFCDKIA